MAVIWAIFHISGKRPISNKLLNNLDIEKEMGVAIRLRNFPEIPQCEMWDFFKFLIIFPISNGLVLRLDKVGIFANFSRFGAGSSWFGTEDFDEKKLLKILSRLSLLYNLTCVAIAKIGISPLLPYEQL